MLSFLDQAARQGFTVEHYTDEAVGRMAKDEAGKIAVTVVALHPRIEFTGDKLPSREEIDHLHHRAHEICFIASSVKTDIRIEPIQTGSE